MIHVIGITDPRRVGVYGYSRRNIYNLTGKSVGDFPVLHFLPVFDFISHFYQLFLFSCLFDDHVNNVSYFPLMSIKKVIPYFCVLCEGYCVIIWLIVRICVFIKD
jgi:hypothetical protein